MTISVDGDEGKMCSDGKSDDCKPYLSGSIVVWTVETYDYMKWLIPQSGN